MSIVERQAQRQMRRRTAGSKARDGAIFREAISGKAIAFQNQGQSLVRESVLGIPLNRASAFRKSAL